MKKVLTEGEKREADSLVKPPKRETSYMTGEGPTLEVLHTRCRTQKTTEKKAADVCVYGRANTANDRSGFSELSDTLEDEK